jgi:hypothetical protein
MRIGPAAILASLAFGITVAPLAAPAQQPALPEHIRTTQTFLMTWGHEQWDQLRTVTGDKVTVKLGPSAYSLEPAAQKSDVKLTLPFRELSTLRANGKITGVKVSEMVFKMGDRELRGPGTIDLSEDNGVFRVTGVTAEP